MLNLAELRGHLLHRITTQGLWLLAAAIAFLPYSTAFSADSATRPNIVLILADDQGWGDLHCHGNERIDTPVLDRLAAESARFDRFYVSPVCAPTRASLLTARDHLRTGVSGVTHRQEVLRADEVTLAEVFRQNGYATGIFGKWHNGAQYPNHPNGQGFDEFFGFCAGHWNHYFDPELEHNGRPVQTRGYITNVLTDAALEWIGQQRDKPFFCYVPYNAPHTPWQVPDRHFDKYKARGLGDEVAAAYGMVENVDENIGRLLQKLDELELANNTIVIFLTDNGPNGDRYNGGMKGRKGSVDEGGVRVPFFIRWPGRLEPREIPQIAAHIDVLPTLMDLCRLSAETQPLDGISLAPLLRGTSDKWPDRMIFSYQPGRRGELPLERGAVRTQQYRLVRERNGQYRLYDMIADPQQRQDIASSQPNVLRRLSRAYENWFKSASAGARDKTPIPVGHPEGPLVALPAPEAEFAGNVEFYNKPGYAHDWLTNWKSSDDRIWWDLDVVRPGRYEVTLQYVCAPADTGSVVRAEAAGQTVTRSIDQPFDTGVQHRPERGLETGGRAIREFAPLTLGVLELPAGRTRLTLSAFRIPGATVAELGGLHLRRKD